jgi:sialic acid synthase SpsE
VYSLPISLKDFPLLIAEIGGNHEGNFDYAKKLTQLAINSGADAVKFQIYTGDTLVSKLESPQRNNHFKKFELSPKQHIELAKMVFDAGKLYSSSVWDVDALDWIDPYVSFYKIGSGDLTAYPILKAIATTGKPLVLSTGLSTENEVVECVKYLQNLNHIYKNHSHLGVLQCTSMYPITQNDAHLEVMKYFKEKYNWTAGYSDHTEGTQALETAVAMGAEILEFHFTDSRDGKSFRDHKVSLTCDEVLILKEKIKSIKALQGQPVKQPLPIEIENGHDLSFRRAVYPSKDINKGEILNESNLTVLRPLSGIDARDYDKLIGRRILCDVKMHQKLEWDFINDVELA